MPLAQCSDAMGTATRTTSRFQVAVFLYQYYVHRLDYRRPHFRCAHVVPFNADQPLEGRWCSLASARSLACARPMRVHGGQCGTRNIEAIHPRMPFIWSRLWTRGDGCWQSFEVFAGPKEALLLAERATPL